MPGSVNVWANVVALGEHAGVERVRAGRAHGVRLAVGVGPRHDRADLDRQRGGREREVLDLDRRGARCRRADGGCAAGSAAGARCRAWRTVARRSRAASTTSPSWCRRRSRHWNRSPPRRRRRHHRWRRWMRARWWRRRAVATTARLAACRARVWTWLDLLGRCGREEVGRRVTPPVVARTAGRRARASQAVAGGSSTSMLPPSLRTRSAGSGAGVDRQLVPGDGAIRLERGAVARGSPADRCRRSRRAGSRGGCTHPRPRAPRRRAR